MPLVGIQSRNPASRKTASIKQSSFGAPGLDCIADVLERQVERGLPKLLDEIASVGFVVSDSSRLTFSASESAAIG
jgi:hypothetical protein